MKTPREEIEVSVLAFFSDVHANVAALGAVLADLEARGVDRAYCLGDLVGYGPHPNEVIELVRRDGCRNHRGQLRRRRCV